LLFSEKIDSFVFEKIWQKMKKHSKKCVCGEHIEVQARYYSDFVNRLRSVSGVQQKRMLNKVDPCFFRYLCRCARGILRDQLDIPVDVYKEQLKPESRLLLKLASNSPIEKKRVLFANSQKGGFLGILARIGSAALASIIGNAIAGLTSKK
jgi:hypothetical protein